MCAWIIDKYNVFSVFTSKIWVLSRLFELADEGVVDCENAMNTIPNKDSILNNVSITLIQLEVEYKNKQKHWYGRWDAANHRSVKPLEWRLARYKIEKRKVIKPCVLVWERSVLKLDRSLDYDARLNGRFHTLSLMDIDHKAIEQFWSNSISGSCWFLPVPLAQCLFREHVKA